MFWSFGPFSGILGIQFEVQIAVREWLRQMQVLARIILVEAHNLYRYRY